MPHWLFYSVFATVHWCVLVVSLSAQQTPEAVEPRIVPASDEAETAMQGFRANGGLVGSLFAAEPMIANPVVFYVDSQNRVFVCESFRQNQGVTDNREHSESWLDADLAAETVEDRRKYHEAQLGDALASYTEQDDRIRVLIDTDGDGVADESHVYADHFNGLVEGTGAGVLELDGDVYYTCIPNLWRLRDHDGDWKADSREALHTGYGVRVAFRGHDLHGLRLGPDGRLYFSIGDRGANIETPQGRLKNTESGSVFRCELDGSKLEIFATGLRNPQELAFDDYGNLFTGDNNSDSGDKARWVYIAEGADSGWRMAYQYLSDRGPFNREKLWHPFHEGQAAYIVPPVANLADGPSGLDYYPGTGFPDDYQGRFFMADFRGTPSRSGIRSFRVEQQGAFFKLAEDDQQPIWGILATDLQFGPDGSLYVSDWVDGWNGEGKGRIYRYISPAHHDAPIVAEVQGLLAERFFEKPIEELAPLLAHVDQRVRLKAQYALASRGAWAAVAESARTGSSLFARLHAMWGLEQIARSDASHTGQTTSIYQAILHDEDAELRAHAARLLGEIGGGDEVAAALRARLTDESGRVRYFAARSLGKLGSRAALGDILQLIEANADQDPVLRHGGVMALSQIASDAEIRELASHASTAVRIAAVVALRRLHSSNIADFLTDQDVRVVREAAVAIHDELLQGAMPSLAKLISGPHADDAIMRRALNANFRLGDRSHAQALASFAANDDAPTDLRLEAIGMLGDWQHPKARDRVLGMWRPLEPRDASPVVAALRPLIAAMSRSDSEIRLAVARVGGQLGITEASPVLLSILADNTVQPEQRAEALRTVVAVSGRDSLATVRSAMRDENELVRAAAIESLPALDPDGAIEAMEAVVFNGETLERQAAINAIGSMKSAKADQLLAKLMQQLIAGELAPEVHLETLAATRDRKSPVTDPLLAKYEAKADPSVRLDQFRETLYGGNASRGRQIFLEKTSVSCLRCHKVFFRGGEVGPDLGSIAVDKPREYLLEAIVDPNKSIAKGFESVIVVDEDGITHVGVLRDENDSEITLMDADGKTIKIAQSAIELRKPGKSAMPEDMSNQLTKSELRDLVEYLSTLKGRPSFPRRRDEVQ